MMDLIFVVLIAEAAAHALGDYISVADGMVVIVTLRREEELTAMGIHLFVNKEDHRGHQYQDFTIYTDPLITAWQCRRECVRHRGLNIDKDNAIACVQWLCTDEEHTPFQWL